MTEKTVKLSDIGDSDQITLTGEQLRELLDGARDEAGGVNTAPAIETGPHLDDPEIGAAKASQLRKAGYRADSAELSTELRQLLKRHKGD